MNVKERTNLIHRIAAYTPIFPSILIKIYSYMDCHTNQMLLDSTGETLFFNFFIPVFWKIKAFAVTNDSDSPVDFRIILLVYDNPCNYNCSSIIHNGDMCCYPRSKCPAVTGKKLATSMLERSPPNDNSRCGYSECWCWCLTSGNRILTSPNFKNETAYSR